MSTLTGMPAADPELMPGLEVSRILLWEAVRQLLERRSSPGFRMRPPRCRSDSGPSGCARCDSPTRRMNHGPPDRALGNVQPPFREHSQWDLPQTLPK